MSIFREKSLERISSPEDLDSYLQVASPPVWFGLGAVVLLLLGSIVWGIFGTMESSVDAVTLRDGRYTVCYVSEGNLAEVEVGAEVVLSDEQSFHITRIEQDALRAEEVLNDYALHQSGISEGEYVYALHLDGMPEKDGSYASRIIVENVHAISFLWN